ncbi:MAG: hypothetical protein JSC189_001218 [Candidatus Tokpelaia sp. JSC189]|nr:MAG: hypothetical protein JSC189_001218 [Candidatus Tokpelaia sp. JSC189]
MKQTMIVDALQNLERRVEYDLSCLIYPSRPWVPETQYEGNPVSDVLIIGGGQSGTTLAFKLRNECVSNVKIIDRNSKGKEGPWCTYARMPTLRTPKHVTGPDLGIPSLSIKAWWEAKYGAQSWRHLEKIPTARWAEYLAWLRDIIGIEIENNTEASDIEPLENGLFAIHTRKIGTPGGVKRSRVLFARNVVLTTGIEGSGQWIVPEIISKNIPREFYAHTADDIDFTKLAGKRVAVVGAGASAFDNAAEALEHSVASLDLYVRRKKLPTVNPYRWMEYTGFLRHFGDLDDKSKWRFMRYLFAMNQPPPQETYLRVARFENFTMHMESPIEGAGFSDGRLWLVTPRERTEFDFLIVGTGFKVDLGLRPELKRFSDKVALWADRYQSDASGEDIMIAAYPYMTSSFQFTEKEPGSAPFLKHIFSYTYGSMPSLAASAGISALKFGMERIVTGITCELFCADADYHFNTLTAFNEQELIAIQE